MPVPQWLNTVSIISIFLGALFAVWVACDVYRHRQPMAIMNLVWPITMLWAGPLGLYAYFSFGRAEPRDGRQKPPRSFAHSVAVGATHCGSGCTLGDLIAEAFVVLLPVSLMGSHLFGTWAVDFILAFVVGIVFQYSSIKPMRDLSFGQGLVAALKADTLSLIAWQAGMYGWMAICFFGLFSEQTLLKSDAAFWFMMQIAMLVGFGFSYPVNAWLIRQGIKEAM